MAKKKTKRNFSSILILFSVVLGLVFGILTPDFMISIRWVGEIFFNMLKMLSLPLIFVALVSSVAFVTNLKKIGLIGKYTFLYIFTSVSIAVLVGLILFNVFHPGEGMSSTLINNSAVSGEISEPMSFVDFMRYLFPPNIFAAAVSYQVLPIVVFAIFFTIACVLLGGDGTKSIVYFFTNIRDILIRMISWAILISPLGIFSLLGAGVADSKKLGHLERDFKGLSVFVVVFMVGLFIQFLWQLLAVKFIAKYGARFYLKNAASTLITAFGTSSSLATLPVAMTAVEKAKVSDEVNHFVLPLTAAINLGGTVMYEASAAIFFSQILGMHLSIGQQCIIFFIAIVSGMGSSGLPESGLITMVTVLRAVNIPASAITILLPLDRILDRIRTVVNTWGNMCCAAVVNTLVVHKEKRRLHVQLKIKEKKSTP